MATYIPNITDVFPEPYIYKPDLAFFDKMLQRKTALYEQGVAKAKSAFESVLYAPLSNKNNIPIRDQYIKQARENLQKMAGMDFSQAQNVAAARGIFSPFWEDKFIVKDTELTKHYQSQASTLDGWKNSTDPKVRQNYNGIAAKYLNNGLDVLVNADRTEEAFSQIEKRKATPFLNIEEYLNEQAGKDPEKLKIVWDETSPNGAYLVKITNGERSKKAFSTWAQSVMGNNFYEQFRVTGTVYKEEQYKQLKKQNPDATDEQIYGIIADQHVKEIGDGYTKRRNQVLVEIARIDGIVKSLPASSGPAQQQALEQYANERAQLYGRLNQIDQEYKLDFTKDYTDQIRNNILNDPDGYFATLSKQRVVDNWATGRSVITSREIKKNDAYFAAEQLQIDKVKLEIDKRKLQLEELKTSADIAKINAEVAKMGREAQLPPGFSFNSKGEIVGPDGKVVSTTDKDGNLIAAGVDPITGARYIGPGVYDVLSQGKAIDVFQKGQRELFNGAYNLSFSKDGLLYFAKNGFGLTDQEVSAISSHFSSMLNSNVFVPGGPSHLITKDPKLKDQKAAYDKLANALLNSQYVKDAGITEITYGPGTMHNALNAYVSGYLQDRVKEAKNKDIDFVLSDKEFDALINYSVANENLARYHANEQNRNKLINDYVSINKDAANKYFNKKDDGTYEFLNSETFSQTKEAQDVGSLDAQIIFDRPTADQVARGVSKGLNWLGIPANLSNNLAYGQTYLDLKINPKALAEAMMSGNFTWNAVQEITPGGAPANSVSVTIKDYNKSGETLTFYMKDPTKSYNALDAFSARFGADSSKYATEFKNTYDKLVPNLQYFQSRTAKQGAEFILKFDPKTDGDIGIKVLDEALNPANATMYIKDAEGNIKAADADLMLAFKSAFQGKEKDAEQYLQSIKYTTVGSKDFEGKPYVSFALGIIQGNSELKVAEKKLTELGAKEVILALNENSTAPTIMNLPRNTGMYIYDGLLNGKTVSADPVMKSTGFDFVLTPDKDGTDPNQTPTSVRLSLTFLERVNTFDPKTNTLKSELVTRTKNDVDYPLVGENAKTPDEIVLYIKNYYRTILTKNKQLQDEYLRYIDNQKTSNTGTNTGVTPYVNTLQYWNGLTNQQK